MITRNFIHPLDLLMGFLLSGRIDALEFVQELNKNFTPCHSSWFQRQSWTLTEAVLIYHNYEPGELEGASSRALNTLLKLIDEGHILDILRSYIGTPVCPYAECLYVDLFFKLLQTQSIPIPAHFPIGEKESATTPAPHTTDANTAPALCANALAIRDEIERERQKALNAAFDEQFQTKEAQSAHRHLVGEYARVDEKEFVNYPTKRIPTHLHSRHRCIALAKFIRYTNPQITIQELYNHPYMQKYGWLKEQLCVAFDTFRKWLNADGINAKDKPSL